MRVLVTGGGGFLGHAVCRRLVADGHTVRALNRTRHDRLEYLGVEQHAGDVRDPHAVDSAAHGADAVVHCAGKAGVWGAPAEFEEINVHGTEHVIAACRRHGVRALVHTSSPSVVHDGGDLEGVDESAPYATRFRAPYPRSKLLAEQAVLAADSDRLATVALRPHVIWGPGDPHFLPHFAGRARRGRLRLVGPATKKVDTVYIDNAAEAHVLALERLTPGSPIAGRAYFITQGDPRPLGEVVNALLAAAGIPPVTRHVPVWTARLLASAAELAYRAPGIGGEPPLTRFLVEQFTTAHWFTIDAARRDLGYVPRVGMDEGLRRLRDSLRADTKSAGNAGNAENRAAP